MKAIILISEASLPLAKTLQRELPDTLIYTKNEREGCIPSHPAIGHRSISNVTSASHLYRCHGNLCTQHCRMHKKQI